MDGLPEFARHPITFRQAMTMRAFRGVIVRVIDGDTYRILLDVGFHTYKVLDIRLLGVNTPEIVGEEHASGIAARTFAESILLHKPVLISTVVTGAGEDVMSFARYVADVQIASRDADPPLPRITSAAMLIQEAGHDKLHPLP